MHISDHKYNLRRFTGVSIMIIIFGLISPVIIRNPIPFIPSVILFGIYPLLLLIVIYRSILVREIDLVDNIIQTRSLFGIKKEIIPLNNILSITKLSPSRNINFTITEYSLCYLEYDSEKELKFFVGVDSYSQEIFNDFLAKVEAAAGS